MSLGMRVIIVKLKELKGRMEGRKNENTLKRINIKESSCCNRRNSGFKLRL